MYIGELLREYVGKDAFLVNYACKSSNCKIVNIKTLKKDSLSVCLNNKLKFKLSIEDMSGYYLMHNNEKFFVIDFSKDKKILLISKTILNISLDEVKKIVDKYLQFYYPKGEKMPKERVEKLNKRLSSRTKKPTNPQKLVSIKEYERLKKNEQSLLEFKANIVHKLKNIIETAKKERKEDVSSPFYKSQLEDVINYMEKK
ncbi:MAG: hypothetical protein ACOCQR_03485 [bacterium]